MRSDVSTKGGYQVERDPEDYPLFIAVHESDVGGVLRSIWNPDFEGASPLPTSMVRYRLFWSYGHRSKSMVDGRPVIPLQETAAFANEHYAHFQSALDMLGRMYDSSSTLTRITVQTEGILTECLRREWPGCCFCRLSRGGGEQSEQLVKPIRRIRRFHPEQRLEPPKRDSSTLVSRRFNDMETLRACVAYENAHQNRTHILRRLKSKADELREDEE